MKFLIVVLSIGISLGCRKAPEQPKPKEAQQETTKVSGTPEAYVESLQTSVKKAEDVRDVANKVLQQNAQDAQSADQPQAP